MECSVARADRGEEKGDEIREEIDQIMWGL